MKRLTILIIGLILLVSSVTAVTVGQILTQQQIDNTDIHLMDLTPSFETEANGNLRIAECKTDADVCTAYITVGTTVAKKYEKIKTINEFNETIIEQGDVYYEVVEKTIPILFRTTKYYNIAQNESRQIAFDTLMADLRPRAIKKLREEVKKIDNFKTKDIIDKQAELLNIVDGRNIGVIEE